MAKYVHAINKFKSHSFTWRPIVLLMVSVYSSNHGVLYAIGINITSRFKKNCWSVHLSVCNANKNAYSSLIINSRILIRISGERAWHSLRENEAIILKNDFSKILDRVFEKLRTCHKIPTPLLTI